MRVLFAGGHGYAPEIYGGVESSTHHLVKQLLEAGHPAAVHAALFGEGMFGWRARAKIKLSRGKIATDTSCGYPVMRSWFPWETARHAVARFRPDVAVVQCHKSVPIAKALQEAGVPQVVYLRNVEFDELAGNPADLRSASFIANSRFTARTYRDRFGIRPDVIPPTIDPQAYATETSGDFVTFVNPYPEKGFDRAVEIAAACPEIPFLFIESWNLDDRNLARVHEAIAPLKNVAFRRRTNDMKSVYARTRILLAPSKWEEAWGRVASEAHCSGIPVVGSSRGGLPEAIGPGGIVLDHDAPATEWAAAVGRLWNDKVHYGRLSDAAREFSRRDELRPEMQFDVFMGILQEAVGRRIPAAA